ncbi:hypothetical protein [Lacrimispora sp.]|uniref:hypothetical protein n=1 Tax=Lacrimispora sp. TaxID=2719234 RepID=UPI0028AA17EA|nr:hypothetical protein [Lacrimispora sp.]
MGRFDMDAYMKANDIMRSAEAKNTIESLLKDLYGIPKPTEEQQQLIDKIKESIKELESTL